MRAGPQAGRTLLAFEAKMNLQEKNERFEDEKYELWLADEKRKLELEDAEAKRWRDYQDQVHAELLAGPPKDTQTLALPDWLDRDIPEPDFLLGAWLTTTSRVLIVGPTGLGKTMFGLAVALAMTSNVNFLHWISGRRCRVLYVDGEMSRRLMKRRLTDAARHAGTRPEFLTVLSKEDFDDMPPLNEPEGQKWMDNFLELNGPFDLAIFDNIQALLVGDMKDEEQWAKVLPWVRSLTRRAIGQIWFHHTGHDETKSYGSKAREWQMDTVILMERVETPGADLSFALKFTKARERTPENRQDFEPLTMSLQGDAWAFTQTVTPRTPLGLNQRTVLGILTDAGANGLQESELHRKALDAGLKSRQRLHEAKRDLKLRKLVHDYNERWYVTNR